VKQLRGLCSTEFFNGIGPYLTFEEGIKGTLEAGKLADMIVLDADPLEIEAEKLRNVKVDLTIIGGRIVYERSPSPATH
jgi:predicted amidohydrolase YtcJ